MEDQQSFDAMFLVFPDGGRYATVRRKDKGQVAFVTSGDRQGAWRVTTVQREGLTLLMHVEPADLKNSNPI